MTPLKEILQTALMLHQLGMLAFGQIILMLSYKHLLNLLPQTHILFTSQSSFSSEALYSNTQIIYSLDIPWYPKQLLSFFSVATTLLVNKKCGVCRIEVIPYITFSRFEQNIIKRKNEKGETGVELTQKWKNSVYSS